MIVTIGDRINEDGNKKNLADVYPIAEMPTIKKRNLILSNSRVNKYHSTQTCDDNISYIESS